MFDTLNGDIWSQNLPEQSQFRATKSLAGRCRGANRAMVLNQKKTVLIPDYFSHITFAAAQIRKHLDPFGQIGQIAQGLGIGLSGFLFAMRDELFQAVISVEIAKAAQ